MGLSARMKALVRQTVVIPDAPQARSGIQVNEEPVMDGSRLSLRSAGMIAEQARDDSGARSVGMTAEVRGSVQFLRPHGEEARQRCLEPWAGSGVPPDILRDAGFARSSG